MGRLVVSARGERAAARPTWGAIGLLLPVVLILALAGFAIPSTAQTHSVTASPSTVAAGRVVYACWTAPPGAGTFDWVVLVAVGAPSNEYVSSAYTNGAESGCAALYVPSAGSFEVRYLLESVFTDVATSNPVSAVEITDSYYVAPTPNPVVAGREVYACWSTSPGAASVDDTVALFDADLPPTTALATQATGGSENGCAPFTVPETGSYEVRYLLGGTLDVAASALTAIFWPSGYGVTASPDPVAAGRVVYACWTALPGTPELDWIALVPVGAPSTSATAYAYTDGATSGCASLYAPSPGSFEVRYLIDNSYADVATSNPISVVAPPGSFYLAPTPNNEVVEGRDVYACWSTAPGSASTQDAIGLFDTDLPPTAARATRGTCGAESGCASFTVPETGSYEVRYLYGGTLDVYAGALTVIASPGAYGLTATASSGQFGPEAEVCWTAPPGISTNDWVALYSAPANEPNYQYVAFQYTGDSTSGCATLVPPGPGTYQARYLINNSYTDVASSDEVALGDAPPLMHAHKWKFEITGDPQNHPQFDVGELVTLQSYVPRGVADGLPADPTIGEYGTGFVRLGDIDPAWTFGSPQPKLTVYDDFASSDGIRLDATGGGRSVSLACTTDDALYADDGFKTREVPVPVLDCPGGASPVTLQDSSPVATMTGELACTRYLPEPSLPLALAAGGLALSSALGRRRKRLGDAP